MKLLASALLLSATAVLAPGLPAVELPGGSTAKLEAAEAAGFVKLASGSGRQEYFVAIDALVGFQPKANGTGCVLFVLTESGIKQTEVQTTADEILKAVKESRAQPK